MGTLNYKEGSFQCQQLDRKCSLLSLFLGEKKVFRDPKGTQKLFLVESPSLVHFLCPRCREGVLVVWCSAFVGCNVLASPLLAFSPFLTTQ